VEALGDAVVAGEAPHGDNLLAPAVQGIAELYQLRQAGLAQLVDGAQEARRQRLALPVAAVFLQQQVAEALLEAVDRLQGGMSMEVAVSFSCWQGLRFVAMAAHQAQQAAVLAADGIDVSPTGQEVVVMMRIT